MFQVRAGDLSAVVSAHMEKVKIIMPAREEREAERRAGSSMPFNLSVPMVTIGLLICSNVFMTFAWYGHLRYPGAHLIQVIFISWGIAFFEYCLQVPANRIGFGHFTAAELKTIQEIISLTVFMVFSVFYLGEGIKWNYIVGFAMIVGAAFVIFHEW